MDIKKLFFTVIHLRLIQVFSRVTFRLFKPSPKVISLNTRNVETKGFLPLKKPSMYGPSSFIFLNELHEFDNLDMWNNSSVSKLWLYNLHYFDDLNASEYEKRKEWHLNLIDRWIDENPPGKGVGWDPYPISLRIVNWIKWYYNGNQLCSKALDSLAVQASYLSKRLEYHLLANHLFANAKALIFAGIFFEGKEADKWIEKGLSILNKEIPEQILQDGGNFERSPMYHSIMIEDMLDLICLAQNCRNPLLSFEKVSEWKEITCKMLHWLNAMCHSDSQISLFNDAAIGIAPEYDQLSYYAERLGIGILEASSGLIDLNESGYISFKNEDSSLIIDAGDIGPDYQPGHAHADTLSFELSVNKKRIIVDSGTSCYGTGAERLRQRSTDAHNTISVDGFDSSEVWGGFRVARRAKIVERKIEKKENAIVIRASHDGFRRRNIEIGNHIRTWILEKKRVTLIDTIEGKGMHYIKSNLHFHPEIELSLNGKVLLALYSGNIFCKLFLDETMEVIIEDSTYHPQFGATIRNKKLVIKKNSVLPFTFKTIIEI